MAEGDTIHRLARRLEAALTEPIEAASAPAPESPLRRQTRRLERLSGSRLQSAEARGKHLLLRFDAGLVLHSHLGMSGSWEIRKPGGRWRRPARRAGVLLEAGPAAAAQFGGTILALRTPGEIEADARLRTLGSDVLADSFDLRAAVASLRAGGGERAIGEALLDQRLLAGVGNIFKSEGCFAAKVDPWLPIAALDDDRLRATIAAVRELMSTAVESGRPPGAVYRRAGRPCPRCGSPIRSRGQGDANRRTYWCPGCQR